MGMTRNDSVSFSIIIPVQNGEKTIERLLGSLIIQKSRILEVLICNDHSTDRTVEITNQYKDVLPITVLNVPDELGNSPGNARQVGLDYASGEWIVFADADDILTFNALGFYDSVIKENPMTKMVVAAFDEVAFDPFRLIDHISRPFAWVHAKAFNAAYIKKHNLRFSQTLYTHEDKYFTFLNVLTLRANQDPEPYVSDTTTYYWCRSPESIVSRDDGKYPIMSAVESMDAIIEPILKIKEEKGLTKSKVVDLFEYELFSTILDIYHKIQCGRDVWGQEEIERFDIEAQAMNRIRKIQSITGWTNQWLIENCRRHPDLYNASRKDSVRTMREFVPEQSFSEFLERMEEE